MTIKDGSTTLGNVTFAAVNGSFHTTVTFQTSALTAGSHTISAVYSGDMIFAGSTGTATQVVQAATTGPSATGTPADSQNLGTVQTQGSMAAATTSGTATTSAVTGATETQLNSSSGTSSGSVSQTISWDSVYTLFQSGNYAGLQAFVNNNKSYFSAIDSFDGKVHDPASLAAAESVFVSNLIIAAGVHVPSGGFFFDPAQYFPPLTGDPNDPGTWKVVAPVSSSSNYAPEQPSPVARRANEAFAKLGDGVLVTKAPGKVQYLSGRWSVWADVTGSGFNQSAGGGLSGNQVNATAGIGYKLRPNVVVGAFGGFENFNYDFAALEGRLKGTGGTVGAYVGWAITPTLHWNTMLGWTGEAYNGSAGTASGSFTGSRWLFSTGLTGSYRFRQFVLEPSVTIFALTEHQSSYADTLGTAHDAVDFSSGRVSLGGRVLLPPLVQPSFVVTPYVGFYGDRYFASNNAAAAGVASAGFGDSWSARAAAGVSMPVLKGGALSLGGDYGGIGANYKTCSGTARVNMPL